ncbi:ABC transporter ATP-binding protein [Corynebacterium sp. H128]|uniref:ABC transporter ATP-binding protein n=1 Tax=Corynebacterium sp. H128 TaxID=3133427 RepID=UPI0030A70B06
MSRLGAHGAKFNYGERTICPQVEVAIPDGVITVIVGPNACGKSTLLKGLSRLIAPEQGSVLLDGADIHTLPTKELAKHIGLLPQGPVAPDGVRVVDLVSRGRYPHQRLFSPWRAEDEEAVARAMALTGTTELSGRFVDELSGGQRQRVWLAVALAQDTDILLLDEPTTYLDVKHQIEVLDLCMKLNRDQGTTMVAVLHDLNQAARYADTIIAMKDGEIVAMGAPHEVITEATVQSIFDVAARVIDDPETGKPLMVPCWNHLPVRS